MILGLDFQSQFFLMIQPVLNSGKVATYSLNLCREDFSIALGQIIDSDRYRGAAAIALDRLDVECNVGTFALQAFDDHGQYGEIDWRHAARVTQHDAWFFSKD